MVYKIRAFLYVYFKSLTSITYYKEVLDTSPQFTNKYYIMLALVSSVIMTIVSTIGSTPAVNSAIDSMISYARELYPSDLIIESDGQNWTINKPEPFIVAMPQDILEKIKSSKEISESMPATDINGEFPKNIIVFDHKGTIGDMEKFDTLMLINEKNLISLGDKGVINTMPLSEYFKGDISGKITSEDYNSVLDKIAQTKAWVPGAISVFIFMALVIYSFTIRLLYLLFVGLILWVFSKLSSAQLKFWEGFRLGVHAITLPLTVQLVSVLAGVQIPIIGWFIFTNLFIGTLAVIKIKEARNTQSKI
ncbi:hypothetical protein A3K34_00015 [candidate division WWE3 bacterium RIFOXYC1_FULL_40_10]|uniref:DUF1189 domain-containing protein n=1 Tax=candidate division WWE3 bacterium RIFOXYA2_FULL_46_9 TaxID=1802636 RepID=A0A1F4W1B6_UNCKA|nr:MAG: hypothetical protein A3K58_00015 [candidate division WWE3 bacterium RIFOXYB1_FULL_40_22]OGC61281.1 MAG: hypothetical protein A3K37_00015 [candidate division WWE3 bacterium RIFOXYA1_FULL_40_11]OGC63191.1 MAG: hypothetical protein A2264_00670 [candidate division WWE3 bacterium RIFOXYA2_FULL_46_9]OGC65272.1 MAG: hypothetical protein A2326_04300 [candidate division WWE3 bacterium RIFOXYB2_FULL_41_6]OGC65664.1 MAG: hypothetical protein A3K34_00015 [candidate division WWE3 bacterium RIFOXYC1_